MKCILMFCMAAYVCAREMHTTLNDNHDFETVVANPDELNLYYECFMDIIPCSDLLESFRKNMQEAVSEACDRCNADQKHMFRVFLEGLKKVFPKSYQEYRKKYDPSGTRFDALEAELSKY